jgi:serine/threonine-protein kinase
MSSRQLTFDRALDLAAQIADGLAFAHERGVVHRDIKPANIMVLPGDRVKITDFGIARMRSAETRTQTGVIQGSPRYLSPEQILGRPCEARSDIFSLGVMLYEMITGRAPFDADDVNAIMYKIVNAKAPPPSGANPTLPGMLDLIVAKTLAKDIDERYPSAAELAADLRACRLQRAGPVQVAPAYAAPDGIASITAELFADTMPEPIVEQGAGDAAIDGTTAYPLAKAFDSMQAVLRFEARNGRGGPANGASISAMPSLGDAESGPAAGASVAGHATKSFRTRAWSERDRRRFVSAVIGAVVVGTAIVLA